MCVWTTVALVWDVQHFWRNLTETLLFGFCLPRLCVSYRSSCLGCTTFLAQSYWNIAVWFLSSPDICELPNLLSGMYLNDAVDPVSDGAQVEYECFSFAERATDIPVQCYQGEWYPDSPKCVESKNLSVYFFERARHQCIFFWVKGTIMRKF